MNRAAIDLWVGLFVAIGLAALLFLALKVGNLSSTDVGETYAIQARFDNIGGLKVRAPVKSAGVVVGRVADRFGRRSSPGGRRALPRLPGHGLLPDRDLPDLPRRLRRLPLRARHMRAGQRARRVTGRDDDL